ncbi:MAG: DUF3854 domain-containing protein [Acidobacteria bacterium]|nr:DUF3854 domain-containing protein [Acidobacteriota bacterium]
MSLFNTPHTPLRRVNRRYPCPICQHADWCSVREDESAAICMRIGDGAATQTKDGGWLHILRDSEAAQRVAQPVRPRNPQPKLEPLTAPIDRCHAVYTALLESLTLSERHADDLLQRGLHDTAIAYGLYASAPDSEVAQRLCNDLAARFDLYNVPGFYRQGATWRMHAGDWRRGYFVPVRDLAGRVQALTTRLDEPTENSAKYLWLSSRGKLAGASSGVPIHFAGRHLFDKGDAIITEGALKAEVIGQFAECAVVGLASVTAHRANLGYALRAAGVRHARIAFDADWRTNPAVRTQLERLGKELQEAGLVVSLLDWSPTEGKGLDDVLAKEAA